MFGTKSNASHSLYVLYDAAALAYTMPATAQANADAIRQLRSAVNAPRVSSQLSNLQIAPQDFSLYRIGSYEIRTGIIEPCKPELVINAADLVDQVKPSLQVAPNVP